MARLVPEPLEGLELLERAVLGADRGRNAFIAQRVALHRGEQGGGPQTEEAQVLLGVEGKAVVHGLRVVVTRQGLQAHVPQDPLVLALEGSLVVRSEEHTSELQSRFDLVCRLLLDKKK